MIYVFELHICSDLSAALCWLWVWKKIPSFCSHYASLCVSQDWLCLDLYANAPIFLFNAVYLALYCAARLHLEWPFVDHRFQAQIIIALFFVFSPPSSFWIHTAVYCSKCLYPMCISSLKGTESPSQQRYNCQQDRQGPIGGCCETQPLELDYKLFPYIFRLWSREMEVNKHAGYLSSCTAWRSCGLQMSSSSP